MNDHRQARTLKDQLESIIADMERRIADDPERLAEAICRLLREPGLRERMGEAGRQWVLEHFSQERQVRQTQEFYLSVWEQCQRGVRTVMQSAGIENQPRTEVPTAEHNR